MNLSPIYWTLLVAAALGVLVYLYLEYQTMLLRTEVSSVPGGLRFSARLFTVEVRRPDNKVHVSCISGQCRSQALDSGEEQTFAGPLSLVLPATGMRIQVAQIGARDGPDDAPEPTGFSTIVFHASDEMTFAARGLTGGQRSTVQLRDIPDSVADTFRHFSSGLEAWFEKLEADLTAEIAAREEQAAREAAEREAVKKPVTAVAIAPATSVAKADTGAD